MRFVKIIKKIKYRCKIISENSRNSVSNVVLNSKKANNANIFVCIKGFKTDGHKYLEECYKNGCRDFIIENQDFIKKQWINDSTIIQINDSRHALAEFSNYFNDYPSRKIKMIGITGTKGKTTVSTLIHHFINSEKKVSLFTTVRNIICGIKYDSERTTMESNELNSLLNESYSKGEKISIVEVSSHAITLKRIDGIEWDMGIFTSFSRDHLDLYETMDNYFNAKLDFFRILNKSKKKNKIAVINMDDIKGKEVASIIKKSVKIVKVGTDTGNDYYIKKYEIDIDKIIINLVNGSKEYVFKSRMHGRFNVMNIALAVSASLEVGIKADNIKKALSNFKGVEGRFEIVIDEPFIIIIDYAHTPLSLQNILEEAKKITKKNIYLVFGCTGERDVDKRSIMGEVAAKLSNFTIITTDDTYQEDPYKISKDIEKGLIKKGKINGKEYLIMLDRKKAIRKAVEKADEGDVIVIAGMGHEKVQILQDGPVEYNDKDTILNLLKEMKVV